MLLIRTRADIVAKHIPGLVARFPTASALAARKLRDVELALRPLGLRWRARRLHELAKVIQEEHGGRIPSDMRALLKLPGVGPYVASSTLAALTGRRVVLADTNTVRVAKRVAGLNLEGDVRRRKDVQAAIAGLMSGPTVATDWLAVLDLAATICTIRDPACTKCPIRASCAYGRRRTGTTTRTLP
jgi:A/G-specific adenine glycosylase